MRHTRRADGRGDAQNGLAGRLWLPLTALSTRISTAALTLIARSRERRALAALDERLLQDIGIDRRAAAVEARKAPWQR